MQETLHYRRNTGFTKGVRTLDRVRVIAFAFLILLLASPGTGARDYIEVWPEGWSEVVPLFGTNIFTDRFFVARDSLGTSFVSADGVYFRELDLTYRLLIQDDIEEEVVLRPQAQIGSAYLGLDHAGGRHVVWLERSSAGNTISYTTLTVPYKAHEVVPLVTTANMVQDLAAFQMGEVTHVVWSEREVYFQIRYAQVENGEVVWLETVTDSSDISVRPSITVDQQGTVHLAWMETSDVGVAILYSQRLENHWTQPSRIGEGSVHDIGQGGSIAMTAFADQVHLAWSALPRNSNQLAVFTSKVNAQGEITAPSVLALGVRARYVQGAGEPSLVWQGVGPFGAQVNYGHAAGQVTNLSVGRKGALRPEAVSTDEHTYVYWLQAHPDGGFVVHGIHNESSKQISLWRRMGIDENAPLYHLAFLLTSTFMLAAVYTIMNIGVLAAAGILYSLLQKIEAYRVQGLFYQVALLGTLMVALRRLPVPAGHPRFFGLVHYGLCYVLATMGTFAVLRRVRQRGLFLTVGIMIIWMLLYQFLALLPQIILG